MVQVVRTILIILVMTHILVGHAQEDVDYYKSKYAGEKIVNSLIETVLTIDYDEDGQLRVMESNERRRMYLSSTAPQYAEDQVLYSEHYQLRNLQAYTLKLVGNKSKRINVEDFTTKTQISDNVFHGGEKSRNFFYPSLSMGAVSVVRDEVEITIPQLLSSFYIEDYYPTEVRKITIHTAPSVNMDFSYINAAGGKYLPEVSKTKKRTSYKWEFHDVEGFDLENDSPDLSYYSPHIIPRITHYEQNGQEVKLLADIDDLYSWYASLINEVETLPSDEIKAITYSLINGEEDAMIQISKIYQWVQNNIKYVAFSEGMEGFIPENSDAVCRKRFGDCKGLTSLMYSMLDYADLDPHFAYVGTRDRPYTYREVPTPLVDNHMILACRYQDEFIFLDGTSFAGPVLEAPYAIQGKQALVAIDDNNYEIIELAVQPDEYSLSYDSVVITIGENGQLTGRGVCLFGGYYALDYRATLNLSEVGEVEEILDEALEKGNNKFNLESFQISDLENNDASIRIDYEFSIEDYLMINDGEMYLDMNLVKLYIDKKLDLERQVPMAVNYKSRNKVVVVLNIPEGFQVTYLPHAQSFHMDSFGYDYNIWSQGSHVTQQIEEYNNFLILERSKFGDWNEMITGLRNIYRESIILTRIE